MSNEIRFRIPRLPHLPEYKTPQNQADEAQNVKEYREELHRSLQEGMLQIDGAIGPGGSLTSPLTTRGDIWSFSTANARFPIGGGTDGWVLTLDSTQTFGFKWAAASGGGGGGTAAAINNYFC